MSLANLLRALLPPVAYDPSAARVGAVIDAEAQALQAAVDHAAQISNAMHPTGCADAIADWERVLAISPRSSATQSDREQVVLIKLGELGGLSKAYFIRLAASAGYRITITEPRAFVAGRNRCGDRLYGADIVFVWQVRIEERPAGSNATTDEYLKTTLEDLGPAHAFVQFIED